MAVTVPEAVDAGQIHIGWNARHVGRIELPVPGWTPACRRVADNLTLCIGPTLPKSVTGAGTVALDAGSVQGAVIVEVTPVFTPAPSATSVFYFFPAGLSPNTNLAKGTVGVPPASCQTHPIAIAIAQTLLTELASQAVGVVEADLDAASVDTPFAQAAFRVNLTVWQAQVSDTGLAWGTGCTCVRGTLGGGANTPVGGIRDSVARDAREAGRAGTDWVTVSGGA